MFTGLIDHCGKVSQISVHGTSMRLTCQTRFSDLCLGESVAVDGVCLTVIETSNDTFSVDCSPETIQVAAFNTLSVGDQVHLERALRMGDRLGGHWVSGHVDGQVTLTTITPTDSCVNLQWRSPEPDQQYLVPKGSIAIAGVSLTVNQVDGRLFSTMIIPHTWQVTRFSQAHRGDHFPVEYDLLLKWASRSTSLALAEKERGQS